MKNYAALSLIALLTITTPAFAAPGENNDRGQGTADEKSNGKVKEKVEVRGVNAQGDEVRVKFEVEIENDGDTDVAPSDTPSATVSLTPEIACDQNAEWKNHGHFVNCVSKLKLGGAAVSAAAKSDTGKKQKLTPAPSVVPSVEPSVEPSIAPSIEPSGEPTPSVSPSGTPIIDPNFETALLANPIDTLIDLFQNLATFLQGLKTN